MENSFSKRIKELRVSLSMTQSEFAKEIGTTQATLSSYENTDKLPSVDILITIAQKYNVSLDWLCGLKNEQNSLTISTYADVIKVLSALGAADSLKMDISITNTSIPNTFETYPEAQITIDDKTIVNFFDEWIGVLALCKKSPSGKKLYEVWIKDILEQYNKPVKINPSEPTTSFPFE